MTVAENMAFGLKLASYTKEQMRRRSIAPHQILQIEHLLERKPKGAVGRPAPAPWRSPRHRALSPAYSCSTSRSLEPRRGAARARCRWNCRPAQGTQDHDDLRHPRRSGDDLSHKPHRGAEQRQRDRAGQRADGAVPHAGEPVRRRLHRPRNELHRRQLVSATPTLATVKLHGGPSRWCRWRPTPPRCRWAPRSRWARGPAHIRVGRNRPRAPTTPSRGHVQLAKHLGDAIFLRATLAGATEAMTVRDHPRQPALDTGDMAWLMLPPKRCFLFDERGRTFRRAPPDLFVPLTPCCTFPPTQNIPASTHPPARRRRQAGGGWLAACRLPPWPRPPGASSRSSGSTATRAGNGCR